MMAWPGSVMFADVRKDSFFYFDNAYMQPKYNMRDFSGVPKEHGSRKGLFGTSTWLGFELN